MKPRKLQGPTARSFGNRGATDRALALKTLLLPFRRSSAWAKQIPDPSGRFECGCATSKRAKRVGHHYSNDPLAFPFDLRIRPYCRNRLYSGCTHSVVPSAQVSRFQMGTWTLRVSINHRPASNATARCLLLTAIATLASPSGTFPRR